ncbi:unnamed protein product, partial [Amoebophrya sp. A25]
ANYSTRRFVDSMVGRLHEVVDWFHVADLPNLSWSLAKLDPRGIDPMFQIFASKVYDITSLDDCAAVALAFGRAGLLHRSSFYRRLSDATTQLLNHMDYPTVLSRALKLGNETAIVCYAFAHSGIMDKTLFSNACKRAIEQKIKFDWSAGIRMLWALAKVRCSHLPFLKF